MSPPSGKGWERRLGECLLSNIAILPHAACRTSPGLASHKAAQLRVGHVIVTQLSDKQLLPKKGTEVIRHAININSSIAVRTKCVCAPPPLRTHRYPRALTPCRRKFLSFVVLHADNADAGHAGTLLSSCGCPGPSKAQSPGCAGSAQILGAGTCCELLQCFQIFTKQSLLPTLSQRALVVHDEGWGELHGDTPGQEAFPLLMFYKP